MRKTNTSNDGVTTVAAQSPTINPYRFGLAMILDRLRWDLTLESYRSRRKLRSWRDRFPGKKAVIVCNGPSLLKVDLSLLKNVFSFGLNKINLLYDKDAYRPNAIVAVNLLVIEQNAAFFNETLTPIFINSRGRSHIRSRENVVFFHTAMQAKTARDCSISLNEGFTVTATTMQLAFHMGFRDIALIGCDHNFATRGLAGATVESGKVDESHFDPRYFSGGQKWQLPDLVASEYYYSMANDMYSAFGGRIVNCTVGGKLDIFPRMELSEWLQNEFCGPTT